VSFRDREKEIEKAPIVIGLFLLILYFIFDFKIFSYIAALFIFVSLFYKRGARFIGINWLRLSEILGKINATIVFSLVFYAFLTPLSFLFRLFNKDPLRVDEKNKKLKSYYITRNHTYKKSDFEKMW
jgi:hypothetical protein